MLLSRRSGYLLLPTLLLLSGFSLTYVIQSRYFSQHVQTVRMVSQNQVFDIVQLKASLSYCKEHVKEGEIKGLHYSILESEKKILIQWQSKNIHRRLLS